MVLGYRQEYVLGVVTSLTCVTSLQENFIVWTTFGQLKAYFLETENIRTSEVHYLYGWGGRIRTYGTRYQKPVELINYDINDYIFHYNKG